MYPKAKKAYTSKFLDPANATGTEIEQLDVYRKVRDELKKYFLNFFKDKNNQYVNCASKLELFPNLSTTFKLITCSPFCKSSIL